MVFVLFLLKLKWGAIYPGLHFPINKEFEMSLTQFSVPSGPYWKSFLKSIGCFVQLRPISSREWTFPHEQFCQASVAFSLLWLAASLASWTDAENKNLTQSLPSARYSRSQPQGGDHEPQEFLTPTTLCPWRLQSLWKGHNESKKGDYIVVTLNY